jgi:hypothetical protein
MMEDIIGRLEKIRDSVTGIEVVVGTDNHHRKHEAKCNTLMALSIARQKDKDVQTALKEAVSAVVEGNENNYLDALYVVIRALSGNHDSGYCINQLAKELFDELHPECGGGSE